MYCCAALKCTNKYLGICTFKTMTLIYDFLHLHISKYYFNGRLVHGIQLQKESKYMYK